MNVLVSMNSKLARLFQHKMPSKRLFTVYLAGAAILFSAGVLVNEAKAQSGSPTSTTQFLDVGNPLATAGPPQNVYINQNNNYVTIQVRLVQLYYSYWDPNSKVGVYNRPVAITIPGAVTNATVYTDAQGVASLYVNNLSLSTQQFTCYVSYSGVGGNYNGVPLNPCSASFAIIRNNPFGRTASTEPVALPAK